jgi:hypothetical protein
MAKFYKILSIYSLKQKNIFFPTTFFFLHHPGSSQLSDNSRGHQIKQRISQVFIHISFSRDYGSAINLKYGPQKNNVPAINSIPQRTDTMPITLPQTFFKMLI